MQGKVALSLTHTLGTQESRVPEAGLAASVEVEGDLAAWVEVGAAEGGGEGLGAGWVVPGACLRFSSIRDGHSMPPHLASQPESSASIEHSVGC